MRLAKVVELALNELSVTVNQYRALTMIEAGSPPMREFAVRLAMHPPNVSTLVDGLVARGLVARTRNPDDGRRVVLSLTAKGRALLQRAASQAEHALAMVVAYDEEHEDDLLRGIDQWELALDRLAEDMRSGFGSRTRRSA